METIVIQILGQAAPMLATIICVLLAWGLAMLRKKLNLQTGQDALNQVDSVIQAVVGDLSQTMVKEFKAAAADGKLTDREKKNLKTTAFANTLNLISGQVADTAKTVIPSLNSYILHKIEERVFNLKTDRYVECQERYEKRGL